MLFVRQVAVLAFHLTLFLEPLPLHQSVAVQIATFLIKGECLLVDVCFLLPRQRSIFHQEINHHRQHVATIQRTVLPLLCQKHGIGACFGISQRLHIVQHMREMVFTLLVVVAARFLIIVRDMRPLHLPVGRP